MVPLTLSANVEYTLHDSICNGRSASNKWSHWKWSQCFRRRNLLQNGILHFKL